MPLLIHEDQSPVPSILVSSKTSNKFVPTKTQTKRFSERFLDEGSRIQQIYQTCVSTVSYYSRQKNIDRGTWKWLLRKLAGIPLAFFYGISLVLIVSKTILEPSNLRFPSKTEDNQLSTNTCNSILSSMKNHSHDWEYEIHEVKRDDTTDSRSTIDDLDDKAFLKQRVLDNKYSNTSSNLNSTREYGNHLTSNAESQNTTKSRNSYCGQGSQIIIYNDCIELYYGIGGVMCCISLASIFSRNIRATMLLLLPGLITRHSRHLLFTIILGVLANGPISNLQDNFNKILDNSFCNYKSGMMLACMKQIEVHEVLYYAKNIHNELQNIKNSFNRMICPYGKIDRLGNICTGLPDYKFPFRNISLDILNDLSSPGAKELRQHASLVMEKISVLAHYGDIVRRCLTVISIILLVIDAVRYLRSFKTDSSFDNSYMSRNMRRYWKTKDYNASENSLTYWNIEEGLRRWEQNQGFRMGVIPKLTKKEMHNVLRNSFTTTIFTIFVLLVLFVDMVLAEAVRYIHEREQQNLYMESLVHNTSTPDNADRPYQAESCLSSANYTDSEDYLIICVMLSTAAVSCILQVYLCGTRAHLCSLFYPERAEERADYLYYNIFTGRVSRRNELLLIIRREIERRQKLATFSPFHRLLVFIKGVRSKEECSFVCPGCGKKGKEASMKELSLHVVNKTIESKVCYLCYLDLHGEQRKRRQESLYDFTAYEGLS